MFSLNLNSLFIFSLTIPGVTFGLGGLDSFPYALVVAIGMLATNRITIEAEDLVILLLVLIFIAFISFIDYKSAKITHFIRQFLNYISLIVCAITLKKCSVNIEKILNVLIFSVFLNFSLGLLQILGLDLFVSNARVDNLRGMVGTFAEPTSLGMYCFVLYLISYSVLQKYSDKSIKFRSNILAFSSLITLIFISQSSNAILVLVLFFIIRVCKLNFRSVCIAMVLLTIAVLFYPFWSGTRIGGIVSIMLQDDIWVLLSKDGSINERLSAMIGPYYGLLINFGMPSSAFSYKEVIESLQASTNGFFWFGGSNKIMNYLGTIIFELSILGIIVIFRYVLPPINRDLSIEVLIIWLIFLSMSVPLAHGYVLLLPLIYMSKFETFGKKNSN